MAAVATTQGSRPRSASSVDQLFELVDGLDDAQIHSLLQDFNNTVASNVPQETVIESSPDIASENSIACCCKALQKDKPARGAVAPHRSRFGCSVISIPRAHPAEVHVRHFIPVLYEIDIHQLHDELRNRQHYEFAGTVGVWQTPETNK
ncbi:hypothetical protein QQZ08_002065 [Neonectria magnoliae]|uniref:Uncharacterized protein n=1 Tax=Neonectria magnoliae TaxID=2732573 RepID=A0ABR1IDF9_9HYPO